MGTRVTSRFSLMRGTYYQTTVVRLPDSWLVTHYISDSDGTGLHSVVVPDPIGGVMKPSDFCIVSGMEEDLA